MSNVEANDVALIQLRGANDLLDPEFEVGVLCAVPNINDRFARFTQLHAILRQREGLRFAGHPVERPLVGRHNDFPANAVVVGDVDDGLQASRVHRVGEGRRGLHHEVGYWHDGDADDQLLVCLVVRDNNGAPPLGTEGRHEAVLRYGDDSISAAVREEFAVGHSELDLKKLELFVGGISVKGRMINYLGEWGYENWSCRWSIDGQDQSLCWNHFN